MLRRLVLCLCLVTLPAHAAGGALSNAATGVAGVHTDQRRISDHPYRVLLGHVIVVCRDGELARALVIRHGRDGMHRLRFTEAWENGTRLPWPRAAGM
jgi:hypothetical protein